TGSATAAASGGTPGYTYSWSTGASGATVSLPAGTHFVTATDDNDCIATASVTITSNTTPPTASISASGATTFCEGGSVILTASGGNSYSWSTGATTAAITVSTTGTYTVTATAANGCTDTESQAVTAHSLPTATITPNGATTFCLGGSVMLTASGGTSYSWSTGATTAAITVSNSGTYIVTATDANGCTDTESQVVTVHPLPTASITPNGATTFCLGGSVMLTASGGTSYSWSTGATTAAITVSNSETYIVTATDANGCNDTENQVVTVHPLPTANISGASSICTGETITLTASGGISFLWSTGATTASISVSATGTYSVTATDANGCTDDASHVVSPTNPLACDDDGDTFTENGGDCNDANPAIFPGATETCNGLDDDCDQQIDEGVLLIFFQDSDGDNYGNAAASIQACAAPNGYVANDDDCDDANSAINPAASEICNNVDDDCSGSPEAAVNTWTGAGDGVNWTDEGNWSDGIVPLSCQDVVIPTGKTVTIPAGFNAVGRTLEAAVGSVFLVDLTATLEVEN
ncbi:MAG: MopE-related protein, partial [Bacteroidota bacterium]